jgi:lipoprotein-releasing system ATP-binding protein
MILQAKSIKKRFKHPVEIDLLRGIDLTVQKGETVAIMGRSGEGKSTLLQILGTLDNPTEGSLTIAQLPATSNNLSSLRNKHLGFIFQAFHLLEDYTVLQNILMPAMIARKDTGKGSASYQRAQDLLEQVGLSGRQHHFGKQLSGGEKQRVAIARALMNDPDLIFADEPSGNLDRQNADAIHHLLLNFAEKQGKSLVVVTHDEQLASLCHTRYRLTDGILIRSP